MRAILAYFRTKVPIFGHPTYLWIYHAYLLAALLTMLFALCVFAFGIYKAII
jgi:hypothetical protein